MKDVAEDPFMNSTICHLIIASLVAVLVKNPPTSRKPQYNSWVRKINWRRDRLPTPGLLGLPGDSNGKESAFNAGNLDPSLSWVDPLE